MRSLSGTDLALLERRDKDAVRPSSQQAVEIGLPERQRELAQVVAIEREAVEGIELHVVLMMARVQRRIRVLLKSPTPSRSLFRGAHLG